MTYKLKNTLAALTITLSLLTLSYSIGQPPMVNSPRMDFSGPALDAQSGQVSARKHSLGIKRQLSMPYFSFAPLLPRKES